MRTTNPKTMNPQRPGPEKIRASHFPHAPALNDRIAQRAYELWVERGGDSLHNWLDAERMVLSGQSH
jgi:hypothetical protein